MPNAFGITGPDDDNTDANTDANADATTGRQVPDLLVVAPYRGHWQATHYPHSRVVKADCGHLAWLSPQGEPFYRIVRTSCLDCTPPAGDVVRMTPGTMDYLRGQFGDRYAQEAARYAREHDIEEH